LILAQAKLDERSTVGDRQLDRHQIEASHCLGHRMLDLQPRIGFDEGEARCDAGARIDEKFDGTDTAIIRCRAQPQRGGQHCCAQLRVEIEGRRDLDEFLALALQTALAVPDVGDAASSVPDNLHLDVARARKQLLDVERPRTEGLERLRTAARIGSFKVLDPVNGPHAAPAAAVDRLQHDGTTGPQARHEGDSLGQSHRGADARQDRDPLAHCQCARLRLVAEQSQRRRGRADEDQTGIAARLREVGVLAEKAIAGVNRVATLCERDRDQRRGVEIGRNTAAGQRHGKVRRAGVERRRVILGMNDDRRQAPLRRGSRDANGDFAPVGDEQLADHSNQLADRTGDGTSALSASAASLSRFA